MISYPCIFRLRASTNKSSDLTEFAYYSLSCFDCFKINFMSSNIHKVIKWIS